MEFDLGNVALGQVFLRVLGLSPVSIFPPMIHTNLNVYAAVSRTNGRGPGTFQKAMFSLTSGGHYTEKYTHFFLRLAVLNLNITESQDGTCWVHGDVKRT